MANYGALNRAQLSYDYLHTNSTTHEFLFGALAELVDNARDACATEINIYSTNDESLRGGYMLCFMDDGDGMDPLEAADIVTFGKSSKKSQDAHLIGMYGNGLKSGSMRVGNDFILFSKKGPSMTCIFLSRTFHEQEDIDEIVVPMPSFDSSTKKPLAKTPAEKEKHKLEMDLILKYSPFHTEDALMKEFDRLQGKSGTLVIIYNMKLLDSGDPELDVSADPFDILLANPTVEDYDSDEGAHSEVSSLDREDLGLMPEKRSFRAYVSILYIDPRMKIYIQGKKVRTKRLADTVFKPRMYKFSSTRFKTRSENEVKKSQEEAKAADFKAREAESKYRDLENKYGTGSSREQRAELRKAQTLSMELRKEAQLKKQISERKTRSLKEPKTLNFIFGVNLDSRYQDGLFFYNCSRLIKMYQHTGPQLEGSDVCKGIIGVVDIPYLVLEPTHNKQDFADAKEYRLLQRAMTEHMIQYWKDIAIEQQGISKFWENFGYISNSWRDPPSQDPKYVRKRAMQLSHCVQCDTCLKWRILPFSANNIGREYPEHWVCSHNNDPAHNRCSAPEQKLNIPEGVLKKEIKSREQKERDLEMEIKKKQEKLEKIQKQKVVTSSRDIKRLEDEEDNKKSSSRNGYSSSNKVTHKRSSKPSPRQPSSEEEEEEEEEEEADIDDILFEDEELMDTSEYVTEEMLALEREQQQIDDQAARLEKNLRKIMDTGHREQEEQLMQEWFILVNKKNALIRRQMQLNILEKENNLERRSELLQRELRAIMAIEDWKKTEAQRQREKLLLEELMKTVKKRDEIVQELDSQERAIEQDEEIEQEMNKKISEGSFIKEDKQCSIQ